MIYKAAGLPFGGRKAVLIGDPRAVETQRLLERAEKRDEQSHGTPAVGKRDALGLRNGLGLGGDSVEHHQSIIGLMVAGDLE